MDCFIGFHSQGINRRESDTLSVKLSVYSNYIYFFIINNNI